MPEINAVVSEARREVAFAPPPHSIAVLPFVNMSGDKEQEYFSDGLSEELIDLKSSLPAERFELPTNGLQIFSKVFDGFVNN
jgi:hypothetical protein